MTHQNLIFETWNYLKKTPWKFMFTAQMTLSVVEYVSWLILSYRSDLYWALFLLYCLEKYIRQYKFRNQYMCSESARTEFTKDGWILYNCLSFQDRMKIRVTYYSEKLKDVASSIHMIINWGIPTFIMLAKNAILILVVGSSKDTGKCTSLIISLTVLMYFFRYKKIEGNFRSYHKQFREDLKKKDRLLSHRKGLIGWEKLEVQRVLRLIDERKILTLGNWKRWHELELNIDLLNVVNYFVLLTFMSSENTATNIILSALFNRFSKAVIGVMNFLHAYQRSSADYYEWKNILKSATFAPEIKQFTIPEEILIEKIDFVRDNFTLKTKLKLPIKKGNKILIQGPSGCGKTTFLDLLQGKMEGLSFSERIPQNYSSSYLEYTDQLRDLPLIDISLREICSLRHKRDYELMMCCLDICELTHWKRHMRLDDKISGKTSTGEKRRLILALMVLYPLFLREKQVLILDEPELGLDSPLAYAVIKNILSITAKRGITTFIVSHLEKIHRKFNWDLKLNIDKGRVRISNK